MRFLWILLIGLCFGLIGWWHSRRIRSCALCTPVTLYQPALSIQDNDSAQMRNQSTRK